MTDLHDLAYRFRDRCGRCTDRKCDWCEAAEAVSKLSSCQERLEEWAGMLTAKDSEIERLTLRLGSYRDAAEKALLVLTMMPDTDRACKILNDVLAETVVVEGQRQDFIPASHLPSCTLPHEHKGPCPEGRDAERQGPENIGNLQAVELPENVALLLTRETMGIDQLESFDSSGVPGPGVTSEMAFTEVKRLTKLLKSEQQRAGAYLNLLSGLKLDLHAIGKLPDRQRQIDSVLATKSED